MVDRFHSLRVGDEWAGLECRSCVLISVLFYIRYQLKPWFFERGKANEELLETLRRETESTDVVDTLYPHDLVGEVP